MIALWTVVAETWWAAPAAVGAGAAGTAGYLGIRRSRRDRNRRIEYDAARLELTQARSRVASSRAEVKLARAEVARIQAEKAASRASQSDVNRARRVAQSAEREVRVTVAVVRTARARVTSARAGLSDRTRVPPLDNLRNRHDAITARWMEYETDPARQIAFPAMSDAKDPATAAFVEAHSRAAWLRPPTDSRARMDPATFTAYRDAVAALEASFTAAEKSAWNKARATGSIPRTQAVPPHLADDDSAAPAPEWIGRATEALSRSTVVIAQVAESAMAAFEQRRKSRDPDSRPPSSE